MYSINSHLDILTSISGQKITSISDWENYRRPEIMYLLSNFIYGVRPVERPENLSFRVKIQDFLGNCTCETTKIICKRVDIIVNEYSFPVTLILPRKTQRPVPSFIFIANESYSDLLNFETNLDYDFLPISTITQRGYGIAIMPVYNVSPDWKHRSGYKKGVFSALQPYTSKRADNSWATISAWAWGASRVQDYFETDIDIDHTRTAVIGHSRAGKTALWAGATDQRFSLTISNSSGCTGAAFTRGKKGEHIKDINISDWFCTNYRKYNENEEMLPVDQHMLLSAIAPRPLYIKSDTMDEWADPEAELKSAMLASAAYELYGCKGIIADSNIILDTPYHGGMIGYHRASGGHKMTHTDWDLYMDFADKHFK